EAVAEIKLRFDISRLQFDGTPVVRNDVGKLTKLSESKTQMIVRLGIALVPSERAPDQVGRDPGAALLQQQQTEIVQRWSMQRIDRQEVPVGGFSLAQASLLM